MLCLSTIEVYADQYDMATDHVESINLQETDSPEDKVKEMNKDLNEESNEDADKIKEESKSLEETLTPFLNL